MKILELFSGYGTASFALKRLGIKYELIGYSDIDKYANQCFKQNHCPEDINDKLRLGDATQINPNELDDFDLLTAGFPCQSFSIAGQRQGELGTRGTLFNEIIRIAEIKQPKYMLLENVKGLTNEYFSKTFNKIIFELNRIGYTIYYKVLNSKDYGTPQNRERIWFVCYRNDMDLGFLNGFRFPNKKKLMVLLKDILEDNVSKKYYLTDSQIKNVQRNFGSKGQFLNLDSDLSLINKISYPSRISQQYNNDIIPTLTSAMGKGGGNIPCITNTSKRELEWKFNISPTLLSCYYKQPKIINYITDTYIDKRVYDINGISACLNASNDIKIYNLYNGKMSEVESGTIGTSVGSTTGKTAQLLITNKIRKLTPLECFKLMGFNDNEINLNNISDSQLYKLAGNGQDVNVVTLLLKELLKEYIQND
jgi:DNA (cytosine-5)-methyltransferase 1